MNIAYVAGSYGSEDDGVGRWAEHLVTHLVDHDRVSRIDVFASPAAGRASEEGETSHFNITAPDAHMDCTLRRHDVSEWGLWAGMRLARRIAATSADLVHIEYPTNAYGRQIGINLLPLFLKIVEGAPLHVVVCLHEYRSYRTLGRMRIGPLLLAADAVICPDPVNLEMIGQIGVRRVCHTTTVEVPPNLRLSQATWDRPAAAPEQALRERSVVYWGLVREGKGVDVLLRALHWLKEKSGRAHPERTVIGADLDPNDPYHAQIRKLIATWDLRSQVEVTGFLPEERVDTVLQEAALVVLPFEDGVSARRSTLMHTMQVGRPVITTYPQRAEFLPQGMEHGKNVWLIPPNDFEALAQAIDLLLSEADIRSRLATEARRWAQTYAPTWTEVAREVSDLYSRLIGAQPVDQ